MTEQKDETFVCAACNKTYPQERIGKTGGDGDIYCDQCVYDKSEDWSPSRKRRREIAKKSQAESFSSRMRKFHRR